LPTGKDARILRLLPEARPGMRKNIVWRTLLPARGNNAPVAMGDRVYLLCDEGFTSDAPQMICLDAKTGRILWKRPVDHLDAWPPDRRAEAKAMRGRELKRWRDYMMWWNRMYWDNEKNKAVVHDPATWRKLRAQALKAGFRFPEVPPDRPVHPGRSRNGLSQTVDRELVENARRVNGERIHWREGWTTYPNAWYGSTFGSVVGDGERIYAVTGFGGAAAYDPDGRCLWVADLGIHPGGGNPHHYLRGLFQLASPVLAGDVLAYYHRDMATMCGIDKSTGQRLWSVQSPACQEGEKTSAGYQRLAFKPRGHIGHMGPGGTPVVLDLAGTVAVISGHGMAVRASDGKVLGQVRFELPEGLDLGRKKGVVKYPLTEAQLYGGGYNSWVACGDVVVGNHFRGYVVAARLSVVGDCLKQETLWCGRISGDNRTANMTWLNGAVYWGSRVTSVESKTAGMTAFEARTGAVRHTGGRMGLGYVTAVAFGREHMVARTGGWHDQALELPGYTHFAVSTLPEMGPAGIGFLLHPPQTKEVTARHIALKGIPYLSWGSSGTTCWGNRIFIRSNDYLWCVGDPAQPWTPPEEYLPAGSARSRPNRREESTR
jgi:hypothetical protein